MEGPHRHLHQHHHMTAVNIDTGDRFPQWSTQETKEFLAIRAELDQNFMETKRNKLLWEVISTRMKEKGYNRSTDQCKCKWKNLVTRYKGCETMEPETMRQQFPYYNELQVIFTARMQRMLWIEAEGGGNGSKKKACGGQLSSEDDDENEDSEGVGEKMKKQKKKVKSSNVMAASSTPGTSGSGINGLKEILDGFLKQHMQMEMQWRKESEAREEERRVREMEWRQAMQALESERLMMDKRWMEREEQRRMREESRAEKRDALITALLNKLRREDHV